MDDSKIIDLFFERAEQAIPELSDKYEKLCLHLSYNILQNIQDAEECVNDTYLCVWNSIPPNRPRNLLAYVATIVRNVSLNRKEANNAKKRNTDDLPDDDGISDFFISRKTLEEQFDEKQFKEIMDEFLSSLDKHSRVMFVKRYYFCESVKDIAAAFGKNPSSTAVKLSRIREKLKNFLKQKGIDS